MYGSLHISESIARLSVAGVVLWCGLSAGIATVVGVGAWTVGHQAGSGYSPAAVTSSRPTPTQRRYGRRRAPRGCGGGRARLPPPAAEATSAGTRPAIAPAGRPTP